MPFSALIGLYLSGALAAFAVVAVVQGKSLYAFLCTMGSATNFITATLILKSYA